MKKHLLLLILLPISLWAQRPTFSVSSPSINLGDCAANTTCTTTLNITNLGSTSITLSASGISAPYSVSPTSFTLTGNASQTLTVNFSPTYNLTYKNVLVLDAVSGINPKTVPLTGRGKYTDANNYYAGTEDLWGTALRTALNTKVSTGHTALGYTEGRNRMFSTTIDGFNGNGSSRQLECIYTGRVISLANSSPRPSASAPDYMNTEHTWPQGFFNSADPMVSDIHHLFPTDADANNERSSFPFANASNRATARCNDMDVPSQNGTCTNQGSGDWSYLQSSTYEPRDIQKGNTARAMMYFITRYPINYSNFYTQAQENVFKLWHAADLPNAKEVARNTGVQNAQGNRNPYVDHPDFVDRIGSFIGTVAAAPVVTMGELFPSAEAFGNVQTNTALEADILFINKGTTAITLNGATVTGTGYSVVSGGTGTVNANETAIIKVSFMPTLLNQNYLETLNVSTSVGNFSTALSGKGALSTPTDVEAPQHFNLSSIYPNPFSNTAEIQFLLYQPESVSLSLYDMLGRQVTYQNHTLEAGENKLQLDGSTLSNGIYMGKLSAGNQQYTFKVTVVR